MPVPTSLRREIEARDGRRCAYCLTSEACCGLAMHVDHVVPEVAGGPTSADNLCLACFSCNVSKGRRQAAVDPETDQETRLFHPLRDIWFEHFGWSADGTEVLGRTPVGRATVTALRMNNPTVVGARRRWVAAGWHPPAH